MSDAHPRGEKSSYSKKSSRSGSTRSKSGGRSGGSAYYANCSAARAAPVYAGEPGYSRKLDRGGDRIGCE